jgi:hypothetical protein
VDRGASSPQPGHGTHVTGRRPSGARLLGDRDFIAEGLPEQFRTFEIVRNSDGTVSILTVDVDPVAKDGSPAATSRTYAVAAQQIFNDPIGLLPTASYNAELVVQLSSEMQAAPALTLRRADRPLKSSRSAHACR